MEREIDNIVKSLAKLEHFSATEADWQAMERMLDEGEGKKGPFIWWFTGILSLLLVGLGAYFIAGPKDKEAQNLAQVNTHKVQPTDSNTTTTIAKVKDEEVYTAIATSHKTSQANEINDNSKQTKSTNEAAKIEHVSRDNQETQSNIATVDNVSSVSNSSSKITKPLSPTASIADINATSSKFDARSNSVLATEPIITSQTSAKAAITKALSAEVQSNSSSTPQSNLQQAQNTQLSATNAVAVNNTSAKETQESQEAQANLPVRNLSQLSSMSLLPLQVSLESNFSLPKEKPALQRTITVPAQAPQNIVYSSAAKPAVVENTPNADSTKQMKNSAAFSNAKWTVAAALGSSINFGASGNMAVQEKFGVSPYAAIQLQRNFNSRNALGLSLGVGAFNKLNTNYVVPTSTLYWGRDTGSFSLVYKRLHTLNASLYYKYLMQQGLFFQAQTGATYITDVYSNMYDAKFGHRSAFGYGAGINRFDAFLGLGAGYQIRPRLGIEFMYQAGLFDITSNTYFAHNDYARMSRVVCALTYQIK
ncbi:MAG: hypothetical protein RL660_3198 [Bacteroidota bacterium]|jgi:hypothetical protein